MGMDEIGDSTCLVMEKLQIAAYQPHLEDLDGSLSVQVNMAAQVNVGKASLSD